ncbi:hypothetical protein GFY24_17560 [Nocardia sp. SYP-A9097]|uniref:hypothetical protein n=1 Tax=Nocardia sp. SYP-A9097 TaxID=2663237 RepID=UPI00129B8409|nr:hypothetical protein [Nocardia sp. SYP-A9097]MRH89233.1 hypothetical protein [Nocardia sp. SYP-A9097]
MRSAGSVRRAQWGLAAFACAVLLVWVGLLVQDRWFDPQRPLADVPEALTFTGVVTGELNLGVNVHDSEVSLPPLLATQCAGSSSNSVSIVGSVGTHKVVLEIVIPPDEGAPRSRQLAVTNARLYVPGGQESMGRVMRYLPGQHTDPPGTITVDADRQTGTMDAWFAQNTTAAGEQEPATHVVGRWRCR